MKKVGLLTFHQVANYGAVLQCYALREKILEFGFECEVIPYSCERLKQNEKILKLSNNIVISLAKIVSQYYGNTKKRKAFNMFLKEKCGMEVITKDNIDWIYDSIIVGSDQVWNIKLTDRDYNYFIKDSDICKKISYAASFGEDTFNEEELKMLIPYLKKFNFISVRERGAQELLDSIGIKKSTVVCDPVLLLEKSKWDSFIRKQRIREKPYVLIYCIEKSKPVFEFARQKAKELGIDVVYLNQNLICENKDFEYIRGASPSDFLNYIYYADFVVTNSFHGTAFSIIFNKNFAVDKLWHGKENMRVNEVLNKLDLKKQTVQYIFDTKMESNIEYIEVNQKLEIIRKKSCEFLYKSLK